MLVCAADELLNEYTLKKMSMVMEMSRSEDPNSGMTPLYKSPSGFVPTEGASAFMLEDYEKAKARGAKIYAEISGVGISGNSNLLHKTMRIAANEHKTKLDVINTAAKGASCDHLEVRAIDALPGNPVVTNTKAQTGHGIHIGGALEATFALKALETGTVPGVKYSENLDE